MVKVFRISLFFKEKDIYDTKANILDITIVLGLKNGNHKYFKYYHSIGIKLW